MPCSKEIDLSAPVLSEELLFRYSCWRGQCNWCGDCVTVVNAGGFQHLGIWEGKKNT